MKVVTRDSSMRDEIMTEVGGQLGHNSNVGLAESNSTNILTEVEDDLEIDIRPSDPLSGVKKVRQQVDLSE
jgi:hypothetical protein